MQCTWLVDERNLIIKEGAMKAKINKDDCIGCGLCPETSPEVFKMDGDKAIVIVDIVPGYAEKSCRDAATDCPSNAISIEE
jgi:ferredoxin